MTDSLQLKCIHTLHENGIHEFSMNDSSMAGADAYLTELEHLYEQRTDTSKPLRCLLDSQGGTLPINYTLQRGKELMARYPNMGMVRTAILTDSIFESRLVDSFMRLMRFPNTRARFFDRTYRNDAIDWLLKDN
jgi:hypothetical protein